VSVAAPTRVRKRRKRFRFSLNGLAIQLSAFALSFTLVALLVVSGSQAAFVEQNEVLENYVPIGTAEQPTDGGTRRPTGTRASGAPATTEPPAPTATEETPAPPPVESTEPEVLPEPDPEVLPEPDPEVELTDSAAGTAMFGNETLPPGVVVERCIAVTYTGTVDPEPVQLYAAATSGDLAPYLDLAIHISGDGTGTSGDCAGFSSAGAVYEGTLAAFAAMHSSAATGRTTWDPSETEETRTFRFSLSVRDDPAAAGKSASFGFSWRTEAS
jgi:hypothetical protein